MTTMEEKRLGDKLAELGQEETTEFWELIVDIMPESMLQSFEEQYQKPQFIKLIGSDRVCTRCGSLVHAGSRKQHLDYHKRLTFGIWSLQGTILAKIYQKQLQDDENLEEIE